jgi:hypothetical protein
LGFHVKQAGADAKLIQHGPLGVAYHRRHPISTIPVARITAHATVPGRTWQCLRVNISSSSLISFQDSTSIRVQKTCEFYDFWKRWSINYIKSSPHYPQLNGVAELAVKEMEKIITIATFNNQTRMLEKSGLAAAMLMFWNTPWLPTYLSPAQLAFGQYLQDTLPFSRQMLHPQCRFKVKKRHQEV